MNASAPLMAPTQKEELKGGKGLASPQTRNSGYSRDCGKRKPRQGSPMSSVSQGGKRPSRTLRAAPRWPSAILDRRLPPCAGKLRSGRRDDRQSNIEIREGQPSVYLLILGVFMLSDGILSTFADGAYLGMTK